MAQHDGATMSTNTSSSTSDKPFPFMRMPRELRDNVYGGVVRTVRIQVIQPNMTNVVECATFESMPCLPMQLVSKQFKREYTEEVARHKEAKTLSVALTRMPLLNDLAEDCKGLRSALDDVTSLNLEIYSFMVIPQYTPYPASPDPLGLLSSIRSVRVTCVVEALMLEQTLAHIENMPQAAVDKFLIGKRPHPHLRVLEGAVIVRGKAFMVGKVGSSSAQQQQHRCKFGNHPKNRVMYRARPSSAPASLSDLELATIEGASYTLQDVEADLVAVKGHKSVRYTSICDGPMLRFDKAKREWV